MLIEHVLHVKLHLVGQETDSPRPLGHNLGKSKKPLLGYHSLLHVPFRPRRQAGNGRVAATISVYSHSADVPIVKSGPSWGVDPLWFFHLSQS
jgi:hypothetical protein